MCGDGRFEEKLYCGGEIDLGRFVSVEGKPVSSDCDINMVELYLVGLEGYKKSCKSGFLVHGYVYKFDPLDCLVLE